MKRLPETLVETIKDENFQDVIAGLGETGIDYLFDEGIIKEVPFVGSIFGLTKVTTSIQDKLFTKKIFKFLFQLGKTDATNRRKQIEKIDNDPNYKTKVGEKILYIIDKCDDSEKAIYIGQLFRLYIQEVIQYEDFLRASKCIEMTYLSDLKRFIKERRDFIRMDEASDMIGTGLMTPYYISGDKSYGDTESGTLMLTVSPVGRIIQQFLNYE
jgi:hypothetical protein